MTAAHSQPDTNTIWANYQAILEKVALAAGRVGVNPASIKIVAVTKTFPAETVRAAFRCGINIIGENRVQEAIAKIEQLRDLPQIEWHLVGHLQTNKVRKALEYFAMIQSVDSLPLAHKLNAVAQELNRKVDVLIEVNTSGEPSKFGIEPQALAKIVADMQPLNGLAIKGLMTVGPLTTDSAKIRRSFALLRRLYEEMQGWSQSNLAPCWLSMGMTDDFEIAIAEGANMLRIGRGIFGARRD